MFQTSLYDLLKHSQKTQIKNVLTFSRELDLALGSGIPFGHITEFVGCPGTGKTQICLQLCVNVQIPAVLGGPDGHAVFIDTRMGYNPSRLRGWFVVSITINMVFFNIFYPYILLEIGSATIAKIQKIGAREKISEKTSSFNIQKVLNGIYVQYVDDYKKLLTIINSLKDLIKQDSKVKL